MTNDLTAIRAELSDGAYPIGWGHDTIISLCDETERLRAENERMRGALSNIIHTFTERSDGSLVTFPGGYYQAMARAALGQEGDA